MKLKQFFIASMAMMLSFVLSANAQNVAKVGSTEYATIDAAIAAWGSNTTLTLLADVELSDVITLKSTEHHILDLGTYTMTAASGKDAFVIKACGTGDSERSALTIKADGVNPGGINAGSKRIVYYKYADGGISGNDRPIIKIEGGVFTASTSAIGTAGIYTIGTAARKCATLNISGGTFNCSILGSGKSKLIISGGTFNYSVGSQGDSTCSRLISGGTFKSFGFMTADDNNTKFWIGTSMNNSNVGTYIDDNGYLVVGGTPITEADTEVHEAHSDNYGGFNSYLKYSSAATNGLYYTSVEQALADNNKSTGVVTVYTDEIDLEDLSGKYKGTIVLDESVETLTITGAASDAAINIKLDEGVENVKIKGLPAGATVTIKDSNNNTLYSGAPDVYGSVAKIGDVYYASLAEAVNAATNGAVITLLWKEGDAPINMAASLYGKNVTITGTAQVDWSKGWLFVGRGGEGNAKLTFDNANLTSADASLNNGSYGIHVSMTEYGSTNKYDGEVVFKNSNIALSYLMNKNLVTVDGGTLTVSYGFAVGARPASETNNVQRTAIMDVINGSTVEVKNNNGMGVGYESNGILNIGNATFVADKKIITANGVANLTDTNAKLKTESTGLNVVSTVNKYIVEYADGSYVLAQKTPNGTITPAYTSASAIWGEGTANSDESFVVELYEGEAKIATASLNNIGNIIDGDVHVTWNIPFAGSNDEYWNVVWAEGYPKYDMIPTSVKLVSDGTEVATNDVKFNAPDDLFPICAFGEDANGNVAAYTSLSAAVAASAKVAILRAGTYDVPTGKDYTLTGGVEGVVFDNIGAKNMGGANVTFNNVTFDYYPNKDYTGLQHSGNLVYNNCTFDGQVFLYGQSETFNGCTFNQNSSNAYNVWTYGAKEVAFNECTFNSAGKSVLIYNEGPADFVADVTVEGCEFNASAAVEGKAAIELDTSLNGGCTLNIAESTASGFDNGSISGNNLWNNKKGNSEAKNNDITIVVNNETVLKPIVLGLAGAGTAAEPYLISNLEELVWFRDDVNSGNDYKGKVVKLTANIDLNSEAWTPIGLGKVFKGTFDGGNNTISNLVVNNGTTSNAGFFANTHDGEIKNLTINNAKVSGRTNVGVVAGQPYTSKYTNIKVTGHVEVKGLAYVGGVGGKNAYNDWTDITVNVDETSYVEANSTENGNSYRTYVGGVIGFIGEGNHTFKNISSNIKVKGNVQSIGGLFGIAHYGNKFENVEFTGSVEAPEGATEVGGIAGVWHNQKGQTVTFTDVTSEGTVTVGETTTTGSVVGGAYNSANDTADTSGSLIVDGKEQWIKVAQVGDVKYLSLAEAAAAAPSGSTIEMLADCTESESVTLPADITFDGNGCSINGSIVAGGNLTFVGHTKVTSFSAGYYDRVITIGKGACLEITGTGRISFAYGNTFNITGSIEDAKTADKENLTPSLIVPGGASITGGSNPETNKAFTLNVENAYIKLGSTTSKNSSANSEFNLNFTNSVVDFTNNFVTTVSTGSLTPTFNINIVNSAVNTVSHMELCHTGTTLTVDNSTLNIGASFATAGVVNIKNAGVVNVANPIMSSHGGNTGTINIENGTLDLTGGNQAWVSTGTINLTEASKLLLGMFSNTGKINVKVSDGAQAGTYTVVDDNDGANTTLGTVKVTGAKSYTTENGDVVITVTDPVAMIGNVNYLSLADAIAAVKNGETITLLADNNEDVTITQIAGLGFTIDGNGKNYTGQMTVNGRSNTNNGGEYLTIKNVNFVADVNNQIFIQTKKSTYAKNITVDGCSFNGEGYSPVYGIVLRHAYDVVIKNSTVSNMYELVYANTSVTRMTVENVNIDSVTYGFWMPYGVDVAYKNVTITNADYGVAMQNLSNSAATFEGCNFSAKTPVYLQEKGSNAFTLTFNDTNTMTSTVENGAWLQFVGNTALFKAVVSKDGEIVTENGVAGVQAKVGNTYYNTLKHAIAAAEAGDTVALMSDITLTDADMVQIESKYNVMLNIDKDITLDWNGHTVNVEYTGGNYLYAVVFVPDAVNVTVTDSSAAEGEIAEGGITIAENGIHVAYMFWKRGTTGTLVINNGTYNMNDAADSMVYTNGDEIVTVNGGKFTLATVGTGGNNGFPWIFSAHGQNVNHVNVNGGTYNCDVAHQYWTYEVSIPETYATINNGDGTWTVTPGAAVAYAEELHYGYTGKFGYATLQEAVNAVTAGKNVVLLENIELTKGVTVANDKELVLDLNGKTVSMVDNSGKASALLTNMGTLTITDNNTDAPGKLSFKTEQNGGTSYASNTISNRGTLTVDVVTIENTSEAGGACYAIDNYAGSTANINGGKITARATTVRVFNWDNNEANAATLNVTDGEIISEVGYAINLNMGNAPYVNVNISGGEITTNDEEYNLAVYVYGSGVDAENVKINVTGGTLNGYFALNGATATTIAAGNVAITGGHMRSVFCWGEPVYGFVSGGTFNEEVDANCVAEGFACTKIEEGLYGIIGGGAGDLKLIDGEFNAYTIGSTVTVNSVYYERVIPSVWVPMYLPFKVTVDEAMAENFDIAYINGVRRGDEDFDGELDNFVMEVIYINGGNAVGVGKTLKANYPYFIRYKGTGVTTAIETTTLALSINNATLYAFGGTHDCTTMTEKFELKGNGSVMEAGEFADNDYAVVQDADGNSGWGKVGGDLRPFRFYMTVTSREGNEPVKINGPMRIVVRGEEAEDGTTIIYDVVYDVQSDGYIYDLHGRRVLEPVKGNLYIINGKKVLY